MKKIIVAEDDKFLSKAYSIKLKKEGYEVTLSYQGDELLEKLKNNVYDLIILDLVMPIKDGFAVLEELKQNHNKTPVIVASNLGQPEDIQKAKDLGAIDYIIKSDLSLDSLIQKIKVQLG